MNKQDIIKALETRKRGQFFSLNVKRPAKALKKYVDESLEKKSVFTCQLASYAKRKPVIHAVNEAVREAPKTPSWVVRVEKIGNLTFWHHANGQQYLAAPVISSQQTQWLQDGKKTPLALIAHKLQASEKKQKATKEELAEKGQAQFMAVKLENIINIH